MKKFLLCILAIIICISLLFGCNNVLSDNNVSQSINDTSDTIIKCKHNWERVENLNEYTAVDKCLICGVTRMYTDPDIEFESVGESGIEMLRYSWDGYGVSQKEIDTCDLGYAIIDCLSGLLETGDVIPKISDEAVNKHTGELPVARGTVWIECGSIGLFRLNPEMTEICKVQTHLGEGKVLQMTDTLKELLRQAWYYHPYDYWSGAYENGTVTLQQVYKNSNSAVEWVAIDNIHIENVHHSKNNQIVLRIQGAKNQAATARLESYQSSDNLGSFESKNIRLDSDEETTVKFTFSGFYNYTYWVSITIDNTKIKLAINPKDVG